MRRKQWWRRLKSALPWGRLAIGCSITLVLGLAYVLSTGHIGGIWPSLLAGVYTIATGVVIPLYSTLFNSSSSSSAQAIPPHSPTSNAPQPQIPPVITSTTHSQPQLANHSAISQISNHSLVTPLDTLLTIFYFNTPHLPHVDEFYGRRRERITLLDRTRKGLCTSIVGPRRIGKTWLMDYLKLAAPTQLGSTFHFVTLDGTMPQCQTIAEFCARALAGFGVPLVASQADMDMLGRFIREQRARMIHPVLCIDEFEGFFNRKAFDYEFFANLRYLAQNDGLTMVISSKSRLIDLVSDHCKTSPFFTIVNQLLLKPFNASEAEEFTEKKSAQAGWNDDERKALLTYGQERRNWPPLRLQLAGQMLLVDKYLAATGTPDDYQPGNVHYWRDFERRLEEKYRGVVPR